MKKPLVSIIIPVYKTEKLLTRCLDSVLGQTLKDIEVIIVNDASPDNATDIIARYASQDSRVHVVTHDKNRGLGAARNSGIKAASGLYIGSVDSDDWVDPMMFEVMYQNAFDEASGVDHAPEDGYDIVVCGYRHVDGELNTIVTEGFPLKEIFDPGKQDIFSLINPAFWNKIWKRSLFTKTGITFPPRLYNEDLAVTPRLIYHSRKIKMIPDIFYNYFCPSRPGSSITSSLSMKTVSDYISVFEILRNFLIENQIYESYKPAYYRMIRRSAGYYALNVKRATEDRRDVAGKYLKAFWSGLKSSSVFDANEYVDLLSKGDESGVQLLFDFFTFDRQIRNLSRQLEIINGRNTKLEKALSLIKQSFSWKITSPLRSVKAFLKNVAKRDKKKIDHNKK